MLRKPLYLGAVLITVPLIFHVLVDTLNSGFHLPRMPTSQELRPEMRFWYLASGPRNTWILPHQASLEFPLETIHTWNNSRMGNKETCYTPLLASFGSSRWLGPKICRELYLPLDPKSTPYQHQAAERKTIGILPPSSPATPPATFRYVKMSLIPQTHSTLSYV